MFEKISNFFCFYPEKIDNESYFINILKALAIAACVIGHYYYGPFDILWIYHWHMPMFFLIGGYLFKSKRPTILFLKKIFIQYILYIIFFYFSIAFLNDFIFNIFREKSYIILSGNIFNDIYNIFSLNFHKNYYFLVGWFLLAYLLVLFIFFFLEKILKYNRFIYFLLGIISIFIGMNYISPEYSLEKNQILNLLCQVLVGFGYFSLGFSIKGILSKIMTPYFAIVCVLGIFYMKFKYNFTEMAISWSVYSSGFIYHFLLSIFSLYSVCFFGYMISLLKQYKFLEVIGENTKIIMSLHFIIFFILDVIISNFYYNETLSFSQTQHFENPEIWLVYILSGIFIPIIIGFIFSKIIKIFNFGKKKILS